MNQELTEPKTLFFFITLISLIGFIAYALKNSDTIIENPILIMMLSQFVLMFVLMAQYYFRRSKP